MNESYNKHYIRLDNQNNIIDGWSDGPRRDKTIDGAILLHETASYQFRLKPVEIDSNPITNPENPPLHDENGVPLYKRDGQTAIPRTAKEIEADMPEPEPPVPTAEERIHALEAAIMEMAGEIYG